jgi:hypothetical protein
MLCLMDFKSIAEYNSIVHKICSKLQFCNQPMDDAEKIEKTLSTFLPTNRQLQQQYCCHNYTKYSALIYDLLQAEKICPVGTSPLSEVHYNSQNTQKKFYGKKFKKNSKGKWNNNRQNYKASKGHNKGKSTQKDNSQDCQRCGCHNHNTRRCHIPRYLVELY